MPWEVEYTDEFGNWWLTLDHAAQDEIAAIVGLLEHEGPALPFPFSTGIKGSRHRHMRELRIQVRGLPYRVLYLFDPRRVAILLIGGLKKGKNQWYRTFVPIADRLYDEHLENLEME